MVQVILLNGGLAVILILYGSFMFGYFLTKYLKLCQGIVRSIVIGFTGFITIFEILFIFCILLKLHFSVLVLMFGVLASVMICISSVVFFRNTKFDKLKIKGYFNTLNFVYIGILVILVGSQMFLSSYLEHMDDDDGYFITISNIALEEDRICLNSDLVYNGGMNVSESFRPQSASWELFLAFFAKVFGIHPAVLAHTVMPALLILLCYMSVYDLGKRIIDNSKTLYMFLIIYAILNLFGGYTVYSPACFLLIRIWQGKAMLVNFAFPMLMGNCIDIYKQKENVGTWIINFLIVVAGLGFTVVGIYLMPIYYLMLGVPYLIRCGIVKQWKRLRKLVFSAVVGMLPVIIYMYICYRMVSVSPSGQAYMLYNAPAWKDIFNNTMGYGSYFVLFLLSVSYLLFYVKGKKVSIFLFAGVSISLFLTFLNPYFCTFVSQRITGVDVYWRLYWMVPIYFTIAYVFAELLMMLDGLKKYVGLIAVFIIISLSGDCMYRKDSYFSDYKNAYKLPEEGIYVAEELLRDDNDITCIFPEDLSPKIRQYSSQIAVLQARGMSASNEYGCLYQKIYNEGDVNSEVITELRNLDVDYIYCRNAIQSNDLQLKVAIDGCGYLYSVN